jgi:secreted protein with Ig-like and vWFA domain
VLIPPDDSVRLLAFVLKQLDLSPLYQAYDRYRAKQQKGEAARRRTAADRETGVLFASAAAAETGAAQSGTGKYPQKTAVIALLLQPHATYQNFLFLA